MSDMPIEGAPRLDKIAAALIAVQLEMPTVAKGRTAQVKSDKGSYSYTYAGLADVAEAVYPILAKHGLAFTALPANGQLVGMLLHSSGQTLTGSLPITGGTPQALGSSITYGRRYLLGCMTGLVTDDDDDGQIAAATPKPRAAAKSQPAPESAKSQPAPDKGLRTDAQSKALWTLAGKVMPDKDKFRAWLSEGLGREVESTKDLTKAECAEAIDALTGLLDGPNVPSAAS